MVKEAGIDDLKPRPARCSGWLGYRECFVPGPMRPDEWRAGSIYVELDRDEPRLYDVLGSLHMVVSDRFREVMEALAPGQCQFLPIPVRSPSGRHLADYWYLHVVNWVECMDMDKSIYIIDPDGSRHYMICHINAQRIQNAIMIGRVAEEGVNCFIRDSMRLVIQRAKLTNVSIYDFPCTNAPLSKKRPGAAH